MQLTFDADVEAFRAEFVAFLDEHLPSEAEAVERPRSPRHIPDWARRWQRLLFDNGWLLPGYPPEFGGRNATILQQYVASTGAVATADLPELQPVGRRHYRRLADLVRNARAAAEVGGADPAGGDDRVARDERARRGFGSGLAAHPGGASATVTTSWSTDRRCGRPAPTMPTCC